MPGYKGVLIGCALVVAGFLMALQTRPVEVPATRASQHVAKDARRKPSVTALQRKLTSLAGNVAALRRQLAANTAADAGFIRAADANTAFLKADGTAADAQKVGGIPPAGLVQGKATVRSGTVTLAAAGAESPMFGVGSVRLLAGLNSGSGVPYVKVANDSSAPLYLTVIGASLPQNSIAANATLSFMPSQPQVGIQIFDGAGRLWTATLSVLATAQGEVFAGQMVTGLP